MQISFLNVLQATALVFLLTTVVAAQSEKEIIAEGKTLYKTQMASWHGTDIFLERFAGKQEDAGGFFSYVDGTRTKCIFFSKDSVPKTLVVISFDSTYTGNAASIDTVQRDLSEKETSLFIIRQVVWDALQYDSTFQFYNGLIPDVVPLADAKQKRVYVFTAPSLDSIIVFGNDYLVTFDDQNKRQNVRRIHTNITPIEYGKKRNGDLVTSTTHMHLPDTGDVMTATDICTLLLYEKIAGWQEHIAISKNKVSIWDCRKDKLTVMNLDAWQKMTKDKLTNAAAPGMPKIKPKPAAGKKK